MPEWRDAWWKLMLPAMNATLLPIVRRRNSGRRGGFTILEVATAASVLALALATSLTVLQMGFRALDTARSTTLAGQILQSVMEDLRMLPWDATSPQSSISALQATNNNVPGNISLNASFTGGDPAATAIINRFTLKRNITDIDSVMKQIELTATWTGIDGRSHSLNALSYYGKQGLYDYIVR